MDKSNVHKLIGSIKELLRAGEGVSMILFKVHSNFQ